MTWIAVGVGGAIGSLLRHALNVVTAQTIGRASPYATFMVNVLGSLGIGLLAGAMAGNRMAMTPLAQVFVLVGVLGGFTTFSSYMLDSLTLVERGAIWAAVVNIGGQVVVGYALAFVGYRLGLRTG